MFSRRVPSDLATNRLTGAVEAMRRDGRAFIDLTGSNPTRAEFIYPPDLMSPLADARALEYWPSPFGSADAREAIARDYARQGVAVDPARIVLTASTSEAYSLLFKVLADADDEILVPRPSYPLFDHLTRLDLVTPVPYDLEYHGRWSVDVDSVARAVTPRTRALLIVSPNNPTGSYVTRPELDQLAAVCDAHDVAIVADEVFTDYEIAPGAAERAGRATTGHASLAFALGGLSKSIGLPQAKLGWLAVSGRDDRVTAALKRLELICDTYLSVSTPVQCAAAELLDRGAPVRDQIAARVRRNDATLRTLAASNAACGVLANDAGWYAVMHVPSYESEEQLVLRLLDAGVLVHPGYFFDFARESYPVVSLLTPEAPFDQGIACVLRELARYA